MRRPEFLILSGIASTLFGFQALLVALGPSPDEAPQLAKECIQRLFVNNGFRVVGSSLGTLDGFVSGEQQGVPRVTVFFSKDRSAAVRLGDQDGRFPISDGKERLSPIERLNAGINSDCLTGRERMQRFTLNAH
jgi:hypothetical protein